MTKQLIIFEGRALEVERRLADATFGPSYCSTVRAIHDETWIVSYCEGFLRPGEGASGEFFVLVLFGFCFASFIGVFAFVCFLSFRGEMAACIVGAHFWGTALLLAIRGRYIERLSQLGEQDRQGQKTRSN